MTASGPRFGSLNVARASLAFAVLLYHLGGTIALEKYFDIHLFARLFGFGEARIPFFFVLSGFVLKLAYARHIGDPSQLPNYLWRRFIRLYPTFWIILLLVMSPAILFPGLRAAIPDDAWSILRMFMLVTQGPAEGSPTGAPVLIVAWTLHYEIAFALVLAAWIASRSLGAVVTLALVLNGIDCASGECGVYRNFLASANMTYFALGAAAAWLARRSVPMPRATPLMWAAFAAYLFITFTAGDGDASAIPPHFFFAGLACVILMCLVRGESTRGEQTNAPWVRLLSDSSYAMYLLHFPIISLVCKLVVHAGLTGWTGAIVAFVVAIAASLGSTIAFHVWIERRVLAWRS